VFAWSAHTTDRGRAGGRGLRRDGRPPLRRGTDTKSNDDHYIVKTVFFALALFFAGLSLHLQWHPLCVAMLCVAGGMLLGGAALVASLPVE
jgi:hypothetical protein